jgi:hypothetical protein
MVAALIMGGAIRPRPVFVKMQQRHSGAARSVEPGISRFPDVQLHI